MKWINPYVERRERMVHDQLAGRGVHDRRVLDAMLHVPREAFVPGESRYAAYSDEPLAVVATAYGPDIPPSLRAQLRPGGRLVMPVADKDRGQLLVRVVRALDGHDRTESLKPVRFVPMIGAQGWPEGDVRQSPRH